jgi:hypothetical protein
MVALARRLATPTGVYYTGVDRFEARTAADGSGLTLKAAYQLLRPAGARTQLLPGDPLGVLARSANSLGPVDLLVISAGWEADRLARAWFYIPRLLGAGATVIVQEAGPSGAIASRRLTRIEIDRLAARATPGRRAAA